MNSKLYAIIFIIFMLCFSISISFSQTSRKNVRLRSLQTSIERAESRIVDANEKLVQADSLISFGDQKIARADQDFFRIAGEVKRLNKDYRSKRKKLDKLCKSKNREVAIQARSDIRKLEEERRTAMREYSVQVRDMKKSVMKGECDIRKGQQLQISAARSLKESEKALHQAQQQYDLAISTFGN
jgi:hypothetical protein